MEEDQLIDANNYLKNNRLSQAHSVMSHVPGLPNVRSTPTTSSSLQSIIRQKFVTANDINLARNFHVVHTSHYGTQYNDYVGGVKLAQLKERKGFLKSLGTKKAFKNRSAVRTSQSLRQAFEVYQDPKELLLKTSGKIIYPPPINQSSMTQQNFNKLNKYGNIQIG